MDTIETALSDYLDVIEQSFNKAVINCGGEWSRCFKLADSPVQLITSGEKLNKLLFNSFSHLLPVSPAEKESNPLKMLVWDEKESGIKIPLPPLSLLGVDHFEKIREHNIGSYSFILSEMNNVFYVYEHKQNIAFVCIRDSEKLPNYFLAAPLFRIIKIWAKNKGLCLLHAGCIGNGQHSLLLVGKGGSGKSTTALLCLIGGLYYLSDDYILVDINQEEIMAYSIFCSGKLHADHLKKIDELKNMNLTHQTGKQQKDKPVMYLNDLDKHRILTKSALKAIVTPVITKKNGSSVKPLSSFEALKALAPSTLLQLNLGDKGDFAKMGDLTRKLPCFKLEVGNNLESIAPTVEQLLSKFNKHDASR